jgi:hypothetical protein
MKFTSVVSESAMPAAFLIGSKYTGIVKVLLKKS